MPQIYPTSTPGTPSILVAQAPLTGGGALTPGQTVYLGLSTSNDSTRNAYMITPAADGVTRNFTIVGVPANATPNYVDLFVGGYLQPSSGYSVLGSALSINTAPAVGALVYVAFSSPSDNRQQYTMVPMSPTIFTFPSVTPQGSYVDVYDGNGVFQSPGTDYNLNIVNGVYSVVFVSPPVTPVLTVFDPSVNSGRQSYALTPDAGDGSTTSFQINSGFPSTPYIDVYQAGLFQMEGASNSYTLSFVNGGWVVTFNTAPLLGDSLQVVFSPATILPPAQGVGFATNPGYQTFGSGLIFQWAEGAGVAGTVANNLGAREQSINWKIPFPTACLWAGVSLSESSATISSNGMFKTVGSPSGWKSSIPVVLQILGSFGDAGTICTPFVYGIGY